MKKIISLLLILSILLVIPACSKDQTTEADQLNEDNTSQVDNSKEEMEINVVIPSGTPTISMVKLMHDDPKIGEGVTINYDLLTSTEALRNKLISGEADIAVIPTNLAAILYNKGVEYEIAGTSIWGNLYLVSDQQISSTTELLDHEIYLFGQGLTPDIIFQYFMEGIGINVKEDLNLHYVNAATDISALFLSGEAHVALIPEPMLSTIRLKKDEVYTILDLQTEWIQATESENSYPQASIVVSKALIDSHKDVVDSFLSAYEENIKWINENPVDAGIFAEELNLDIKKDIVAATIPQSNIKYEDAKEAKEDINNYYKILFDYSPTTVGGKIPDEDLYYQR